MKRALTYWSLLLWSALAVSPGAAQSANESSQVSCQRSLETLRTPCEAALVAGVYRAEVTWTTAATGNPSLFLRDESGDTVASITWEVRGGTMVGSLSGCRDSCYPDSGLYGRFVWRQDDDALLQFEVWPYKCWQCEGLEAPIGSFSLSVRPFEP